MINLYKLGRGLIFKKKKRKRKEKRKREKENTK
jgi:hypothetical protein